jgi:hypothetical protein
MSRPPGHDPTQATYQRPDPRTGRLRTVTYTACSACMMDHDTLGRIPTPWEQAEASGHASR